MATTKLRLLWGQPLVKRTVLWCIAAVSGHCLSTVAGGGDDLVATPFGPKVPFLGLIITAGTFQYRTWRELVDASKGWCPDCGGNSGAASGHSIQSRI